MEVAIAVMVGLSALNDPIHEYANQMSDVRLW